MTDTIIERAISEDAVIEFKALIQDGHFDVNYVLDTNETLLTTAVLNKSTRILNWLIRQKDIEPNKIPKKSPIGDSALMIAVQINRPSMILPLLKVKGIDINLVSRKGLSALSQSIYKDNASIVNKLIEDGAIVRESDLKSARGRGVEDKIKEAFKQQNKKKLGKYADLLGDD